MLRDKAVSPLSRRRGARNVLVRPKRPAPNAGQRSKHGLGAAERAAIAFDQLHGSLKLRSRYLGESLGHDRLLERNVFDTVARFLAPASDPSPAEIAVAVEHHHRFHRQRCHSSYVIHTTSSANSA